MKYKIDLSPSDAYYPYTLYEFKDNKWQWVDCALTITDLEEIIKERKVFPLYYEE